MKNLKRPHDFHRILSVHKYKHGVRERRERDVPENPVPTPWFEYCWENLDLNPWRVWLVSLYAFSSIWVRLSKTETASYH